MKLGERAERIAKMYQGDSWVIRYVPTLEHLKAASFEAMGRAAQIALGHMERPGCEAACGAEISGAIRADAEREFA